jgi:hypothetical protein
MSFVQLDDQNIIDALGLSNEGHNRSFASVDSLVSCILRAETWISFLLHEMKNVTSSSVKLDEGSSKPSFNTTCSPAMLLRKFYECFTALRTCLERKVVLLIRLDVNCALECILRNRAPQVLATLSQYLRKIRSDNSIFSHGETALLPQKQAARAQVTCQLCSRSPLFEYVVPQGKDAVCVQCHNAAASQTHSFRPCDLLSLYALKLLRGEAHFNDDDMKAVMYVFESVYPSAEFSMSKSALMCVGSTLHASAFSTPTTSSLAISEVILPRWVALSLFPEYSTSIAFSLGDAAPSSYAATLGWCDEGGDSNSSVTPLESAVLSALSSNSDHETSPIASKLGTSFVSQSFSVKTIPAHLYFTGLPGSVVDFCLQRLLRKGLLPSSAPFAVNSRTATDFPSEFRVPYSASLSTLCLQLLNQTKSCGQTDEAFFIWEALKSGQTIESVGCNVAHLMTSSIVAATDGKFWTVSPSRAQQQRVGVPVASHIGCVHLPRQKTFVFVKFDDSVLPSLSIATSVAAAHPLSVSRFEQLLAEAAQALLQQSSIDLSTLASSMKQTHGSLPRAIFSIMSGDATSLAATPPRASNSSSLLGHAREPHAATCILCVDSGDDNPIAFYNSCGHGLCRDCWKSLVSATIVSSSTPDVNSGEDLTGAVTVLSLKCSADPDGKCQAKIDFGVLCKAVPHLVQPFIRSTMSNLSRLLLSGGAGTCQCVCGSVVSGVSHTHHILKSVLSHPSFRRLFLILKSSANAATFSALLT